jgi:hypothetical protein
MATRCMLRGSEGEARKGLSLSLEQGHEGRIRDVLQEDRCSSMYSNIVCLFSYNVMCSHNMLTIPYVQGN